MTQPITDPDALATLAFDDIRDATADAHAAIDKMSGQAHQATTADAELFLRSFDDVEAPDLLGATTVHAPSLAAFLATARDQLDPALAKDKTFKAAAALADRVADGPVKAAVERLLIRAYAEGSSVARAECARLVQLARGTPAGELPGQLGVALLVHDGECAAQRRDLADVVAALAPSGRELATVRTSPMRRVAGLDDRGAR